MLKIEIELLTIEMVEKLPVGIEAKNIDITTIYNIISYVTNFLSVTGSKISIPPFLLSILKSPNFLVDSLIGNKLFYIKYEVNLIYGSDSNPKVSTAKGETGLFVRIKDKKEE